MKHQRFRFKNSDQLIEKAASLGIALPFSEHFDVLFEPLVLGEKQIKNRFVVHPMEGFDSEPDGSPGELAFRRYGRYAKGGSGLIWFEATAVVQAGRSNPRQLFIHSKNIDSFKRLVDHTRKAARESVGDDDIVLVIQLTHSGRFSKPQGTPAPVIAQHNPILDPIQNLPADYPIVSDDELDQLQETMLDAALLARDAGFDGVDVKACHGYLFSELLAAFKRSDSRYGGSLENRSRFLIETMKRIHESFPELIVTCRLNVFDGLPYPYGFGTEQNDLAQPDLSEVKIILEKLIALDVPLLNISLGNPYVSPHLGRPYDIPVRGASPPDEHPLVGVDRFIRLTSELQSAYPDLPLVGTGYSWLRHYLPHVAAGVMKSGGITLVGQGRGAFAYPDSVNDLAERGMMEPGRCCVTCSACTQIMRDGGRTGCVVHDSEIYADEYRRPGVQSVEALLKKINSDV